MSVSQIRLCGPVALVTVCAALLASTAVAIPVPNFSFENPTAGDGGVAVPIDWIITGGGVYDPTSADYPGASGNVIPLPAPGDGFQVAWNNVGPGGFHTIDSAFPVATVAANTFYDLTVALGDRQNVGLEPGVLTVQLLVDGNVQATFISAGNAIADGTFIDVSTGFVTLPVGDSRVGGALTIRLTHGHSGSPASVEQANFDNVRLDATLLPEPTGLLALPALALLGRRSRRA